LKIQQLEKTAQGALTLKPLVGQPSEDVNE